MQILGSEIREGGLHGLLVFFVTCMTMGPFYSLSLFYGVINVYFQYMKNLHVLVSDVANTCFILNNCCNKNSLNI